MCNAPQKVNPASRFDFVASAGNAFQASVNLKGSQILPDGVRSGTIVAVQVNKVSGGSRLGNVITVSEPGGRTVSYLPTPISEPTPCFIPLDRHDELEFSQLRQDQNVNGQGSDASYDLILFVQPHQPPCGCKSA